MNSRDWLIGCGIKPTDDLVNALDEALALQRKWCADKVSILAESLEMLSREGIQAFEDACLNATGED